MDPISCIPKPEPPIQQLPQRDYGVEGYERGELPPIGVSLFELPIKERKKYMWAVPKQCRTNPEYEMEPDDYQKHVRKIKAEPEDQRKKKEKEEKDKDDERSRREKEKEDKIDLLMKHLSKLTEQVNELTKKIK